MRFDRPETRPSVIDAALAAALLVAILVAALALRVWRLDARPLSTDETLTTLIAIGHSYRDVPIGQVWPLSQLDALLTPVYGLSWSEIWRTLADPEMHHAHPPAFYWLTYGWINWLHPAPGALVWALRIIPALLGTLVVGVTFGLGRAMSGTVAGLAAALLMAISPLAVQMSQDARNYTLPLLFICGALWTLVVIVQRLVRGHQSSALWVLWTGLNVLSCYSHYFAWLSVAAQVGAIALLLRVNRLGSPASINGRVVAHMAASVTALAISCLPLATTLLADYGRLSLDRSDNEWLTPSGIFPSVGEALLGWLSMVAPTPNGAMPFWMQVAAVLLGGIGIVALAGPVRRALSRARQRPPAAEVILVGAFGLIAFTELLAINVGLQKDVLRYTRYHFVYFPAALVLLAAALTTPRVRDSTQGRRVSAGRLLAVGLSALAGTTLAAFGYGFQEPYQLRQIARDVAATDASTLTVMGGDSFLTTSMGLAIAREIRQRAPADALFAYMPWQSHPPGTWPGILTVPHLPVEAVWLIHHSPLEAFAPAVELVSGTTRVACGRAREDARRSGLEYQRYRCAAR